MELALDKVPFRVDALFFATVLGVLALSVLAMRVAVQRAGQVADLWTRRAAMGAMLWLVATGLVALSDALRGLSLSLFTALMILTGGVAFSRVGTVLVAAIGPVGLIGFQFFRVPVAVFLRGMYQAGQAPVQITYVGLNFDIFVGLTAPAMAWLVWRGKVGFYAIWAWNAIGLMLLAEAIVIAILSMPTEFRVFTNEPTSTFATYAPYIWLPTVLAPAALFGHLLVLRWLSSSCSGSR
ncbi:MAG: hypothetical protein F4Z85_07365 [Gemmatimonadetes bacterium]|nr:hypothetical protein [Gemmatimonadota bacterium]MYB67267.1 hypothetical protein [Gemmatimonadota bacterium]